MLDGAAFFPDGFVGKIDIETPDGRTDQAKLNLKVVPALLESAYDDGNPAREEHTRTLITKSLRHWPLIFDGASQMGRQTSIPSLVDVPLASGAIVRVGTKLEQCIILSPLSMGTMTWDVISAIAVAVDIFMVPFTLAFDATLTDGLFALSFAVAFFWSLDMIRSCILGFSSKGVVEMRLKRIVKHYLKTWFLPDLLLVAIDWFVLLIALLDRQQSSSNESVSRLFRTIRVIRTARAMAFARIFKVADSLENLFSGVRTESLRALLSIGLVV